jgi:hypothetical protein
MKITIKGQDYTAALDAARSLTIERNLNEPSVCQLWLSLPANGSLTMPCRNQPLTVTGDDGTPFFSGYIAVSPLPEYSGLGIEGPRYRIAVQALSDELLLDQLLMQPSTGATGETAGALMTTLVTRTGATSRTFAKCDGEPICSGTRRAMEQERRTSSELGAGGVSSAEWGPDTHFGAEYRACSE